MFVEHPTLEKEVRIIHSKVPAVSEQLAAAIARFVQRLRQRDLRKLPGVAETLDWTQALLRLHQDRLDAEAVRNTLGCLLKDEHDIKATDEAAVAELLADAADN
jgi:MoxR-like ATPase